MSNTIGCYIVLHRIYGACTITALGYCASKLTGAQVTNEEVRWLFDRLKVADPKPYVRDSELIEFINTRGWHNNGRVLRLHMSKIPKTRAAVMQLLFRGSGIILGYDTGDEKHAVFADSADQAGVRTLDGPDERLLEWPFFDAHVDSVIVVERR